MIAFVMVISRTKQDQISMFKSELKIWNDTDQGSYVMVWFSKHGYPIYFGLFFKRPFSLKFYFEMEHLKMQFEFFLFQMGLLFPLYYVWKKKKKESQMWKYNLEHEMLHL